MTRIILITALLLFSPVASAGELQDGLRAGLKWCSSPTGKCHNKKVKAIKARYLKYEKIFKRHTKSKLIAVWLASVSVNENPHDTNTCNGDQCGVMALNSVQVERCGNIDPMNRDRAIWCAVKEVQLSLQLFKEAHPYKMPLFDLLALSQLHGGIGNDADRITSESGCMKAKDGKLIHPHPFDYMIKWLFKYNGDLSSKHKTNYQRGIQIARWKPTWKILHEVMGQVK